MNIRDIDASEIDLPKDGDYMHTIFINQGELMVKYKSIEQMPDWPLHFQSKNSQVWFKDFLWRTVEEISEAMEALHLANQSRDPDFIHAQVTHFFEEISDAIHFLVELMIIADIKCQPEEINLMDEQWDRYQEGSGVIPPILAETFFCQPGGFLFYIGGELIKREEYLSLDGPAVLDCVTKTIMAYCSNVQYKLGLCGNVLKNKRWKQTAVTSDENLFSDRIAEVFQLIMELLFQCGLGPKDIFRLYSAKRIINTWRQDTKY